MGANKDFTDDSAGASTGKHRANKTTAATNQQWPVSIELMQNQTGMNPSKVKDNPLKAAQAKA